MSTTSFIKEFKKWQAGLGAFIALILVFWGYSFKEPKLAFSLLGGFLLGYALTRSRFGFAGGIKRIYVRGEGSLTKAILTALAVTTVLYAAIHYTAFLKGAVPKYLAEGDMAIIPGTQNVFMANIGTVIGGFLFGIGMIIAGGCASGTLADLGEGEGHALIAFPLFVLATIPGHYLRAVVDRNPIGKIGVRGYLPEYFGYFGALIVTLLGLLLLYYITRRYEYTRNQEKTYMTPDSDYQDFEKPLKDEVETTSMFWSIYHKLFVERWNFIIGAIVLSIVSTGLLIFNGKAWGVTSAFTKMAVWFFSLFGVVFKDESFKTINEEIAKGILADKGVILDIGIVFGSFVAFLMAGRFRFDFKFNAKNAALFGLGGLLMGFGSRFAKGCNIGALYSSIPNFSISGWVFLVAISLGAVAALKIFKGGKSCLVPPRHRDPKDFK